MVKGLQKQAGEKLVGNRDQLGPWKKLDDFLRTTQLFRGDLTALAAANALSVLGAGRRSALWIAEAAPYAPYIEENLHKDFPEESPMTKAEKDFEAFGTTLDEHPAGLIKKEHWCYPVRVDALILAKDLEAQPRNLMVKVFGMVLVRQAPATAKGMVFFTLEDESGFINLAFTPQVYDRASLAINGQGFLCVEGRLQKAEDSHGGSILVSRVFMPELSEAEVVPLEHEDAIEVVTRKTLTRARNYM
jgi:error-prone DNA polymerase